MSFDLSSDFSSQISDLQAELTKKRNEETEINDKMTSILRKNGHALPRTLNLALARIRSRLTLVESDGAQLKAGLEITSILAENVSGKVRELDLAKTRVVECLQFVDDLLDLRRCSDGVLSSIEEEDFETAARHIQRFLALDQAVFQTGDRWANGNNWKHQFLDLSIAHVLVLLHANLDVFNHSVAHVYS